MNHSDDQRFERVPPVKRRPRFCTCVAGEEQQVAVTFLGRDVPFTVMPLGKLLRGYVVIIEVLPGEDGDEEGEDDKEGKVVSIIMELIQNHIADSSDCICSCL